jgi:alkylhydroperoxidase family enzyme
MPDESEHYLDFESLRGDGPVAQRVNAMAQAGWRAPTVLQMLACRTEWTEPLGRLTNAIMRGPGHLPTWQRELIAGLTSRGNHCVF